MTAPPAAVELAPGGPRFSPIVAGAWRMAAWGLEARERLRWIEECLALGVTAPPTASRRTMRRPRT